MTHRRRTAWLGLGLFLLATAGLAQEQAQPSEPQDLEERVRKLEEALAKENAAKWTMKWQDTFRLTSPDGRIALNFGGRLQNDWAFFSPDPELEAGFDDGTEFRRARLFFGGTLYERVEFRTEYDFASGESTFKDVYVGLVKLPGVGGLRIGHYREPFSLEALSSSNYLPFLERGLAIDAFVPFRNMGVMLHRSEERYSWAAGAFLDADDFGRSLDGDSWSYTGRITGVPWSRDEGKQLLHLGLSLSERDPSDQRVRIRSRPESHLAPQLLDTGNLAADSVCLVGLEAAWVHGPLSLQGEHVDAMVEGPAGLDVGLDGSYFQVSWFLTGENRRYRSEGAIFDRRRPARELGKGAGAWELAARYSTLDLTEANSGKLEDLTFALNWYPYANVRAMLNYVIADLEEVGNVDILQLRFQVDF